MKRSAETRKAALCSKAPGDGKDDPLQPEKDATLPVMEIVPLSFPLMPGEYYRRQATRVRYLALDATTPTIKDHVASVALQYEKLAEGAEAGCHDPQ